MTVTEQKKKLDSDMLGYTGTIQGCILMENYDSAEDAALLLMECIRRQRLLCAAPKPARMFPSSVMAEGGSTVETFQCVAEGAD